MLSLYMITLTRLPLAEDGVEPVDLSCRNAGIKGFDDTVGKFRNAQ